MPDMMVVNVPPYEGEYVFDLEGQPFSTVEWRWLKKISGYMPLTIDEGWKGGDPDLFLAFAVIAMRRSGKIAKAEVLEVAEIIEEAAVDGASITFKGEASEEAEASPPPDSSSDDEPPSSGESSPESTEPLPGEREPESFWHPGLGHWFGLRPADIGEMTPAQLMGCVDFMEQSSKRGKR